MTPVIEQALRLWAEGIVHRRDRLGDQAISLLRQLTLDAPGEADAATLLASLLIRRASAWARGAWSWSNHWIDNYPYDNGDPEGDEELGGDYFRPWLDVIAYRDEAERLLDIAPADPHAALLAVRLGLDRWVTQWMLAQELPDDADVQATRQAALERLPVAMRRAEELCGVQGVTALLRAEVEAARADTPGQDTPGTAVTSRWSWYVIYRDHLWHANGELACSFLFTTDPAELRWAHDVWATTELYKEASFVLHVYQAGERVLTVDLATEPLPTPVPELAGEPLPFGQPAYAHIGAGWFILHHGYSEDISR